MRIETIKKCFMVMLLGLACNAAMAHKVHKPRSVAKKKVIVVVKHACPCHKKKIKGWR